MVQESESRFCSDQQTILQALDPIHRSLLINNSEFENIDRNSIVTFNQFSSCEVLQQQQQQTQQEKQHHRKNSIESKHFYDTSSSEKPDTPPCVSDSNCLMLFNEFHTPDECAMPSNDKQSSVNEPQSRKNIRIRIVTNIRRPSANDPPKETMSSKRPPKGRMSSESQTDSSSYEHVDTDSEIELSSGGADERTENSGGNTNTEEFSDYGSNNYGSSSNDEATTTSSNSDSTAPMIQIVQQITEQRTVVSTVNVNKKKVKNFQKSRVDRATVTSIGRPKWINTQKIIDDNVCNEILDETINCNVVEGEKQKDSFESPFVGVPDTMIFGVLKAKPKYTGRKMGKLLERRLARTVFSDAVHIPTIEHVTGVPSTFQPIRNVPPAKPPRTFTSSSSKSSSGSIGANTATTLRIEDHKSLPSQNSSQMSPGGGWIFDKSIRSTAKPTCPTLDEIIDMEHSRKIGWVPSIPKHDEFVHVINMLNDEHPISSKITSCNLTPEPQFQTSYTEDIDQVDSREPPKLPTRSKQMSMDLNNSMCNSTPVKRSNQFSSHSVPNSARKELDICKKCKMQITKPTSARKSFGKGAMKRTKLFFQASRNILVKTKPKPPKPYENSSGNESYVDLDDDIDETPSKWKLNTTADFNTNDTVRFEKKTEKALDLTPKHSENVNNIDGPRRILDKLMTSVKRTPPKKPIRHSLGHKDITRSPSNNEEESFNFDRTVDSPKAKAKDRERSFQLSPRKLFFSANERPHRMQNSYRSFEEEHQDDLRRCIVEYLRSMNEQIEDEQEDLECTTVPHLQSRVRNFSTSSDVIDCVPQHQRVVEIDCHPEPLYSEIVVKPPTIALNHMVNRIMVNDNPKAIYTTVNKIKNRNVVTPVSLDVEDAEEPVYKSWNSLDKLPINNNFADSVFNMLSLMENHNPHKDSQMRGVDDLETQQDASEVATSCVVEPPVVPLTSERFQQSAFKTNDKAVDDNVSMETFRTESLCEDVIRGDSVNRNIVKSISAFDQLENLVSEMTLAEPETDDECGEHGTTDDKMNLTGDSVEYHSISDVNASNSPTQDLKKSFHPRTATSDATLTTNARRHYVRSPLVAAPSMIEIPDQFMLKLTGQIIAQRAIRNQLKQAIQICRTTKEFECSSELIEAERLMLLSAKKETHAKLELTRIDYEENGLTVNPAKCVGTVTIKNIEVDLKPEELLEEIFQLWYVCICSFRDQVVATHPQERNGDTVRFDDISLKIGSLNSSFEIKLEIFVLRLPKPLRKYSHESKYHLNKISKKPKPLFPNPVKLFSNATASHSKPTPDSEESRFRLRGVSTISANCLSSEKFEIIRNASWPKQHVYISYNTKSINLKINDQFTKMTGALRTEFICEVSLSDTGLAGLLSIDEGTSTKRKMWWCRIVGGTIACWNNDIDCLNGKAPILSIDLTRCTNELFELIDCSIAVNIFNDEKMKDQTNKSRIKRYRLSAINQNDLILWLTELNRILKFIKDWNIW